MTGSGLSRRNFTLLVAAILVSFYMLFWPTHDSALLNRLYGPKDNLRDLSYHRKSESKPTEQIPNNLHYVWLTTNDASDITFGFKHFLSAYSAHVYLNPDTIYIHIDASDEVISRAVSASQPDIWTKLVFSLPNVQVNKIIAPDHTKDGKKFGYIEHRSDFARSLVVAEFGGVYFDWDVYALRDFRPLRAMGFANVCGLEKGGLVNSGLFMSVKDSALLRLMISEAHKVFDGGWTTHSSVLLTRISRKLMLIPYEVLILEQAAWAPGSWEPEDAEHMFRLHFETGKWGPASDTVASPYRFANTTSADADKVWETEERFADWQEDFTSSYAIHGFKSANVPETQNFGVNEILSRQSNFARAVYPVVKHAIEAGLILDKAA